MNQRNLKPATYPMYMSGLSLSGTVIDRTRMMVPRDKPMTEIVTYTIQDNANRKFFVDDHTPSGYHELQSEVSLPIYIKSYVRKNGEASYTLNVQKTDILQGENF